MIERLKRSRELNQLAKSSLVGIATGAVEDQMPGEQGKYPAAVS